MASTKFNNHVKQKERRETIFNLLKDDFETYYEGCEHRTLLELKDSLFRSYQLAKLFKSGFELSERELELFNTVEREFKR